jgi:protoporphyrinogen oxidase
VTLPRITILGAGPAGIGAAYQLRRLARADVQVFEQRAVPGGNAGSFVEAGQRLDFGSHRLHPACDKEILADIRALLGEDLLDRPRHGRIRLRGRWIHFPLKPLDLLLRLDPGFALGSLRDMVLPSPAEKSDAGSETFASVLQAALGPTICRDFYFPYVRKIWGLEPDELSPTQARRRVSANSFAKLIGKVASQVPGLRREGAGRFYYPRNGYGQISDALAGAAHDAGAELLFDWRVTSLQQPGEPGDPWIVRAEQGEERRRIESDFVWSTIPISAIARIANPGAPASVQTAAQAIRYRSMILVYLQLPVRQFTEFDAHYLPQADVTITRLSEPKNYSDRSDPENTTVLCAELPCSAGDQYWESTDEQLGELVARDLDRVGLPLPASPLQVFTRRLRQAYPIYEIGYEHHFSLLDEWVEQLPRFLSFGRQGLFAHDNTHHALFMARSAVECLVDGRFDQEKWRGYREIFETHVVED